MSEEKNKSCFLCWFEIHSLIWFDAFRSTLQYIWAFTEVLGIQNVCEGSSKWDGLQSSYQLLQPRGSSLPGFLGPRVWDCQCCAAGNLSCPGQCPIHLLFQELLKEAGLQGKLECFQLEAEKLPEVSIIILFKNREHLALIFSYLIQVSLKHEIVAVPTVILFRGGKAVDRCEGLNYMPSIILSWASKWEIVNSMIAQGWRSERGWADEEGSKPRSCCTCYPACCSQGTLPLVHCLVDETIDSPQEDLNTKLKRLINAHKCMLFMKVRKVLSVF